MPILNRGENIDDNIDGSSEFKDEYIPVAPSAKTTISGVSDRALTDREFKDIKNGDRIFYLVGDIVYKDVMKMSRTTQFCYVYSVEQNRFEIIGKHNDMK